MTLAISRADRIKFTRVCVRGHASRSTWCTRCLMRLHVPVPCAVGPQLALLRANILQRLQEQAEHVARSQHRARHLLWCRLAAGALDRLGRMPGSPIGRTDMDRQAKELEEKSAVW